MSEERVCEKNDELIIDIIDIGTEGEGIGRIDGYTLFVKDAVIGDRVRVKVIKTKKRFGYARLMEIIKPSVWRVEPVCDVARQCGGCQLQHFSYKKQLEWKQQKVLDCLERIGGFDVQDIMEPIMGMDEPFHYRNKAQFPVGYDKKGNLVTGFYAGRTHSIIPCMDCEIQHPVNSVILRAVLEYMNENNVPAYNEKDGSGLVRHILTRVGMVTGDVMVCLIINGKTIPHKERLIEKLLACDFTHVSDNDNKDVDKEGKLLTKKPFQIKSVSLNINMKNTNVILGDKVDTIYGNPYIEDYIGDIKYRISPLSFYQVNPLQTKKLYETALEYADLKGGEVVWDLYCGIGTISLFLAQKAAKVCGVEIVPQAIEDAKNNAKLNGMTNTEFFVGAAEDVVPKKYAESDGMLKADVVTIDPPRKGCDEKLLQTVIKMQPKKIVYVSCDPATLARDLKYLAGNGYRLERVRACDMFGHSFHVETVVLLSQRKADDYVEVELELDELDITSAETKATYREIQQYVMKQTGMIVSDLNIAQVRRKCGLDMRENYNLPKSENAKQPKCPEKKEKAIVEAVKYYQMK